MALRVLDLVYLHDVDSHFTKDRKYDYDVDTIHMIPPHHHHHHHYHQRSNIRAGTTPRGKQSALRRFLLVSTCHVCGRHNRKVTSPTVSSETQK